MKETESKIESAVYRRGIKSQVELKAKDFALAMTDHNIKDKDISGKEAMNDEVVKNSQVTRQALLSRGIRPEYWPAEEDLKRIETRRNKEQKNLSNRD